MRSISVSSVAHPSHSLTQPSVAGSPGGVLMRKAPSRSSLLLTISVCGAVVGFFLSIGVGVITARDAAVLPENAVSLPMSIAQVAGVPRQAGEAAGLTGAPKLSLMPVMAMGRWVEVPLGSRVAAVAGVVPPAGDLVDVEGAVLEAGAGMAGRYLLNGVECWGGALVHPSDAVDVVRGDDVVETIAVEARTVPQDLLFKGAGPFFALKNAGCPGVVEVRRGELTGEIFGTEEKVRPKPASVTRVRYRPREKKVVLTLDDGPSEKYTSAILDLLKAEGVRAVFFMLGRNVATRPALVKRMAAEGHELANHGYSHVLDETSSQADIKAEIERTSRAVKKAAGSPTVWFRPPGGVLTADILQAAQAAGHRVVLWDIDSEDWLAARDGLGAAAIVDSVLDPLPANGSVLLFHDGGGNRCLTVEALATVIRRLKAAGYGFCTLSELAGAAATYDYPS